MSMKKKLTIAAIFVAVALTGCGGKVTPESLLKEASKAEREAKSAEASVVFDMEATLAVSGMSVDMEMGMDLDMEMTTSPVRVHATGDMKVGVLGQNETVDVEMYIDEEDGKAVSYAKASDSGWILQESASTKDLMSLESEENLKKIAENLELEKELETVNEVECYKLTGNIPAELIESSINFAMEGMQDNEMFEGFELEAKDVAVEYYVGKKDRQLVKILIDMKELMKESLEEAMKKSMEDYGDELSEEELGLEVEIGKCLMEMYVHSYNKVEEITIPEEVKEEAEPLESLESFDVE